MGKSIAPIPEPPKSSDPALRSFLNSVKEALEVRLGRRGDPLEQAVTKRDLIDAGVAKLRSNKSDDLAPVVVDPEGSRVTPPSVVGFTALGVFGGVTLTWENPFEAYNVHALTEVWRAETNDRSKAILINSSRGGTFFDRIPDDDAITYWYWVRFVSEYSRYGPFSVGKSAAKEADVGYLMEQISGEIDKADLSQSFAEEVALMQNSYNIKLDVSGYVAGFGLYNSGLSSDFAVMADRFWIAMPGVAKQKPFVVTNGRVYIDTAVIRDASIQEGKLGPITFGKITDSAGNPVTTVSGKLRADAIDVASLRVTDANISGVLRSSQVASNGQPRWMLDKNGGMAFNGSGAGGRMELRDAVIKVFDGNGARRVQIGDLSL